MAYHGGKRFYDKPATRQQISGGALDVRVPRDEEEAVYAVRDMKLKARAKQRMESEARTEAETRAKITLPKFSWDK
jgi:hypothetical protein